ncbi:methyl-accepting chemotaxis protein [Aeromonas enterica]
MFKIFRERSLLFSQISVFLIFIILVSISFFGLYSIKSAADRMGQSKDVVADILPPPLYLIEAQLTIYNLLRSPITEQPQLLETLARLQQEFKQRNTYWQSSDLDKALATSLLGEQRLQGERFWQLVEQSFLPALKQGDLAQASQIATTLQAIYTAHRKAVDNTVVIGNQLASDTSKELLTTANVCYGLLILATLLGCILVIYLARPTQLRLTEAGQAAAAIAAGNLNSQLPAPGKDVIGELIHKISNMRDQLGKLVSTIQDSAQTVHDKSINLTSSAKQHVAHNKREVATAVHVKQIVELLHEAISHVSERLHHLGNIASKSEQEALTTDNAITEVETVIDAMMQGVQHVAGTISDLASLSEKIASLAENIKQITDQTNMLALNAAIEAARAGEQGRGFAVVADEVRALAIRTQGSTSSITDTINQIQNVSHRAVEEMEKEISRVAQAVEQAAIAKQVVVGIHKSSGAMSSMLVEVNHLMEEENKLINDINDKMTDISQLAEEASANAQASLSEANSLEQQSRRLTEQAMRFQLHS